MDGQERCRPRSATSQRSPKATSLGCNTRRSAGVRGSSCRCKNPRPAARSTASEQRSARASANRAAVPGDQLPRHQRAVEVHPAADQIVTRTLTLAILLTGIAMIFFLRSWRSAIVVCVSIPTSLAIAITAMKLMHLTIDTISLLGMSLVIGILVDDSTVVLENIERHFTELKQPPEEAAVRGREEIGAAAVVITLVDVVVFLPIAFIQGQVGRQIAEFAIVVVISTLTSLFVSFTITPTLAGFGRCVRIGSLGASSIGSARSSTMHETGIHSACCPGVSSTASWSRSFARARSPWRWRWSARRRRRRVHSAGRPRRNLHAADVSDRYADSDRREGRLRVAAAGAQDAGRLREHGRRGRVRGVIRRFRLAKQRRSGSRMVERQPLASDRLLGERSSARSRRKIFRTASTPSWFQPRRTSGGNAQPIDFLVTDVTGGDPTPYAQKVTDLLRTVKGATSVNSTGTQLGARDLHSVRSEQGAGARRRSRPGGTSRGRGVRRQRRDAVRDDRRTRASAGDLSGVLSDEHRRAQVGGGSLVERRPRLPWRHRALRLDADGAAHHANRPQLT